MYVNSGEDPLTLQRYGVDPTTGALTLESEVTLDRPLGDIAWNADETRLTAGYHYTSIFEVDPATGVITDAPLSFPTLADGESYLASSGDFLTFEDGKVLGVAYDGNVNSYLVLFDFDAGTSTVVGQVPFSVGAALSGGRVYLASTTGEILSRDALPLTATNTGTIELTDVVVDDARTGQSTTCATLAPGDICVLEAALRVTQADAEARQVVNTGSAQSTETALVEDSVTTVVEAPQPGPSGAPSPGDAPAPSGGAASGGQLAATGFGDGPVAAAVAVGLLCPSERSDRA